MARSLLVGLAVCGLVLVGATAEAGLRRGCKGGSCGVSTGCANGSCSVPVYDKAPVQAPVQKSAAVDAPAAPVVAAEAQPAMVATSTPAMTVANDNGRVFRGRLFSRRAR